MEDVSWVGLKNVIVILPILQKGGAGRLRKVPAMSSSRGGTGHRGPPNETEESQQTEEPFFS